MVENGRVDGSLAVSRGFGDFVFKMDKDLEPGQQAVSCIPEIKKFKKQTNDQYIILACDGIWDCLSNEQCTAKLNPKV